jgi:Tfp pilus assembly protein FimV
MRKRYRVSLFAAIVAALIVPVGFALSLDSSAPAQRTARAAASKPPAVSATIIVRQSDPAPEHMSDAAKLLLVGTTLLGLAAVVRKAI